ncbi:hypothetical protein [Halobacillus seohaensis]|uniref:Uncharacterized protein n=1 Tax=Halobacillus seohaensis TaxID=447421 RepID=A0ABW2ENG7_9BACI
MRRFLFGILLFIVIAFSYVGYTDMEESPNPEETFEQDSTIQQY